jgi:hypothetical protein
MKTLLFCTSYADSENEWAERYKKWYEYYGKSTLAHDQRMIFDDASPVMPSFLPDKDFYRFDTHLGRDSGHDYAGWYRSFSQAAVYGQENGFEKIIHAESDAYFISPRIIDFINSLTSGWHTFWCHKHNFQESALQVICPDQIQNYRNFTNHPYSVYRNQLFDAMLPYTDVHRHFIGDRYGEYLHYIPGEADYSCQTRPGMLENYLISRSR